MQEEIIALTQRVMILGKVKPVIDKMWENSQRIPELWTLPKSTYPCFTSEHHDCHDDGISNEAASHDVMGQTLAYGTV